MALGDKAYLAAQSCYIIVVNNHNEWLFIHRANTGYQDGLWSLPGGHVRENEPINYAAAREANEEIGIDIDPSTLELVYTLQRNKRQEGIEDRVDHYFMTPNLRGAPQNMEPMLHDAIKWINPNSLPDETVEYIKLVCDRIAHGYRFGLYNW